MPNPRLAARYAKSIIGLAIETNQLEKVYTDMLWLQSVCKTNRDFVNVLRSPIINAETKKKIIGAVMGERVSDLTTKFMTLLFTKGREIFLPEIISAFIQSYKQHKDIKTIRLTTATPVGDNIKQAIITQVKKSAGFKNVELEEQADPDVIGGFVLQIGDQLIDASIAYDLREVAKQFENNDFIYKLR